MPPMLTRRHGAKACQLDDKVYVLGGMYVDERPVSMEEKFCDVFDAQSGSWTSLPRSAYRHMPLNETILEHSAFFGAGAVSDRLVALLGSVTAVYNPQLVEWRVVQPTNVEVGSSSCCAVFKEEQGSLKDTFCPHLRHVVFQHQHKAMFRCIM